MSWVTCEPKSTIRILSCPASRSEPAPPRTREESRTVIYRPMCDPLPARSRPPPASPQAWQRASGRCEKGSWKRGNADDNSRLGRQLANSREPAAMLRVLTETPMHSIVVTFVRRTLPALLIAVGISSFGSGWAQTSDPLPSWNDGPVKKSITDFVPRVTTPGGADFVPRDQRIATFDNDGTLWAEQPMYFQIMFAMDRVKALAPQHPDWKRKQPFKSVLDDDRKALAALGEKGFLQIMAATHTGMTSEEFTRIATEWIATARHPRFNRPFTDLVYQPMLELLAYMRENGFKTFIVSAAASSSCGRGRRRPTAFRPSRWSALRR